MYPTSNLGEIRGPLAHRQNNVTGVNPIFLGFTSLCCWPMALNFISGAASVRVADLAHNSEATPTGIRVLLQTKPSISQKLDDGGEGIHTEFGNVNFPERTNFNHNSSLDAG